MPRIKKRPLWTKDELRKEEVRGIFAIGVIATLISLKISDFKIIVLGNNLIDVLMFQVFLWIGYLLLMSVALSDDIGEEFFGGNLRENYRIITNSCKHWAKIFFGLGILIFLITALITVSAMFASM
jgi:hypothetical protein